MKELVVVALIIPSILGLYISHVNNEQKESERQEFMADVVSSYSVIADWEKMCNKKINKPTELYKIANLGSKLESHMTKYLSTHDEICSFEN